ncbi:MAG: pyridoxal phosphate-dependent aminotransferase [Pseudomonadota bacterium]|nr:pyridoxal phosphate-dependent aminotransferase [Pseudomonadota bacterium]
MSDSSKTTATAPATPSIAFADRVTRIAPSPTVAISTLALDLRAAGRDVIGLAVGEPDFDTPPHVKEAAIRAIHDGHTKYTQVDGIPELKEAAAEKFRRENGLDVTAANISVGTGGKQVLFNALMATVQAGDEVIIPAPYWVSFAGITEVAGGTPVFLPSGFADGLKLSPERLEAAITPRTRWVIINSPSNPTGMGYGADELLAFADVIRRHPGLMVISDDLYEHLTYDGFQFGTIAGLAPDLADRVLTLNGVSKSYCMTGWRIGFAAAPVPLVRAMARLQSQSTSSPGSIAQHAAVAALNGPTGFIADNNAAFARRRAMVVDALNAIDGISCPAPDGAFYVFADISGLMGRARPDGKVIDSDSDFAAALLELAEVAVVPGVAFGLSPAFRLSFAAADDVLHTALGRIADMVASLR